jgi:hypothetical protein
MINERRGAGFGNRPPPSAPFSNFLSPIPGFLTRPSSCAARFLPPKVPRSPFEPFGFAIAEDRESFCEVIGASIIGKCRAFFSSRKSWWPSRLVREKQNGIMPRLCIYNADSIRNVVDNLS